MRADDLQGWVALAERQAGVVSRDQLRTYGLERHFVRAQLSARRWQRASATVLVTTTGPLSREQRLWVGVLQADRPAALAGLTALEVAGLRGWTREEVTVLVPKSDDPVRLDGYRFLETRRDVPALTAPSAPPRLRVEPATLLFAAYERSERTGCALLAAVVQQRLTTVGRLREELAALRPLRRAPLFRLLLGDIEGGAQSMAEVDLGRVCARFGLQAPNRQTPRRDRNGRRRWLDAEWHLPDGRIVVLEVDGAFHGEVDHWWDDMGRERELVISRREVLRCSSYELRRQPERVAADLARIGVPPRRPDERGP
jgi:hypothetical protein